MIRRILLVCGIVSSVLYVATDVLAALRYEGYSLRDQNYSELLATGVPTRPFMLAVTVAYNLLLAAFAVGVWRSAGPKRTVRMTAAMIVVFAALGWITGSIFQMDMRGTEATPLGRLHPPMTAVMSLFIVLSMVFGAMLLDTRFRYYSYATIVILVVFGVVTGLQAPRLAANQPTSWMGLAERVNIYATMLWFAVLAISLLRAQRTVAPRQLGAG